MMNDIVLNNGVSIPPIATGPGMIDYRTGINPSNKFLSLAGKVYMKCMGRHLRKRAWSDCVAYSFRIGYRLLGTDHIDLLQFHWPVTDHYIDTWLTMEKLYREGKCRVLGVANCHQHHLEAIMEAGSVVPAIDQFEVYPLFTQKPLIEYCKSKGIQVQSYSPIARFDDRLMRLPVLHRIAAAHGKTVVQVILRWHVQNGLIPVIRSWNKDRLKENLSIFDFELTPDEMRQIDGVNINARVRYDPDNCDFSIL